MRSRPDWRLPECCQGGRGGRAGGPETGERDPELRRREETSCAAPDLREQTWERAGPPFPDWRSGWVSVVSARGVSGQGVVRPASTQHLPGARSIVRAFDPPHAALAVTACRARRRHASRRAYTCDRCQAAARVDRSDRRGCSVGQGARAVQRRSHRGWRSSGVHHGKIQHLMVAGDAAQRANDGGQRQALSMVGGACTMPTTKWCDRVPVHTGKPGTDFEWRRDDPPRAGCPASIAMIECAGPGRRRRASPSEILAEGLSCRSWRHPPFAPLSAQPRSRVTSEGRSVVDAQVRSTAHRSPPQGGLG